jgi:hypothetical protein
MTAYNALNKIYQGNAAGRNVIADPGDGKTIRVSPTTQGVCIVTGGTTRLLPTASTLPIGTKQTVISQTTTITVSGVALADGEFAEFLVTLDSNGARQWVSLSNSNIEQRFAQIQAATTTGAEDISAYNETLLKTVLTILAAAGILTDATTT